jgi:hypothetical protein
MTQPGWYPDPHGGNRYWDGQQWTDQYVPEPAPKGLPIWLVVGWFVLWALAAFGAWWFVLLMVTFGCDSGWQGCETVGMTTVILYAVVASVGLLGLLIWAVVKPTPGVKILAFILMPIWVVLSVVIAFASYFLMAQAAL